MTDLPDFVVIGAMKCGTSTLHAQLAAQPQFFMSDPKEPNFFSDDDVYAKGAAWYRSLFAKAPAGSIKGESSTHYTKLPTYPKTVDRLAALIPDAKFVYLMRDPIERLVSHYIHEWSQGAISRPIEAAIGAHPELIDYGRYAYQLEPFVARFGKERMLALLFEEMTAAPQQTLDRVARFLGAGGEVRWRADLEAQNVSAERIRRFPGYALVVDNPLAAALRRTLAPKSLRERVKAHLQMRERPQLRPETIRRLTDIFEEDLGALSRLLGSPFSRERFAAAAQA
jgi:hypothetical protein